MKINSIKFLIIIMLILMMTGILLGLFMVEIPEGNTEVLYMLLGVLAATLGRAVSDMFKKE